MTFWHVRVGEGDSRSTFGFLQDYFKARIRRLSADQRVPPALIDLAHTVRAEGNVGVHEEEWTEEEAKKLIDFARLFFIYVYTLPAGVKEVETVRGAPADQR